MDAAGEDHEQATLKRTYLSLLSHAALQELVLSIDAGTRPSVFPSDLRAEVQRIQAAAAVDTDADGEGSPDPQPAPAVASRAPSVPPPAGGPRTRAGAARAYAAALATSKDSAASGRPSPAPGGISFPRVGTPTSAPESQAAFAPIPQPYPALVVHLPSASSPIPAPTPSTPAPVTGSPPAPAWQSPTSEGGPGPVRNSSAKKTRTGVIGGFNPITAIGPSSEGLPSYEEMIVLALMENQSGQGTAPKDVFAWMSARWPLNANFRPSASQALQKAYKRGRLEKVGAKYKLNPNWHGGATTNRTTRRPQSMAELPGNYAWAPPPVAPVHSVPPDPRARASTPPTSSNSNPPNGTGVTGGAPSGSGPEFDAQAHVASLLKALQEAGPPDAPDANAQPGQNLNQGQAGPSQGEHAHVPHMGSSAVAGPNNGAPGTQNLPPPPPLPSTGMANGTQGIPTGPPAPPHPHSSPVTHNLPPIPPPAQPGMPVAAPQHGMPQSPHGLPMAPAPVGNGAPGPVPAGMSVPYGGYHSHPPTALQASLATLASQLANMSKSNQSA